MSSGKTYRRRSSRGILLATALFALLWTLPSFAVLDQDVSTVQADQDYFHGTRQVTSTAAYTLHEIHTATGVIVREYVSQNGKVFAVAWQGPWLPDLKQLLGEHFDEYRQVQAQSRVGHGPRLIAHPSGLMVEMGGHMRGFVGRAYLSDRLPANVRAEEIR